MSQQAFQKSGGNMNKQTALDFKLKLDARKDRFQKISVTLQKR